MKRILIAIPVINLWEKYTRPLLENIKNDVIPNTAHEVSVFVVDNGSSDETSRLSVPNLEFPFIEGILHNQTNEGISRSWNVSMKRAIANDFDYVFFLNNDVLLNKNTLDVLVERMEKGDVGMVTGMDVKRELADPTKVITMDNSKKEKLEESESLDFSAFLISKDAYKTVGEFDEGFSPAYFEDNDYHYRMKLAGVKAVCVPKAIYYHFGNRTQIEAFDKPVVPSEMFLKNMEYFVKKWGGTPANESFKTPFNNKSNSIKTVYQHEGI